MFQDEHTSSRFSTKSSVKKNKEIKESISENNPVPSNFLSRQKPDEYLLEILSEAGKKDEIFSDRSLMKAQENLTNTMGPLGQP